MIDICPHDECTGCSACFAACPADAIGMKKDEQGFLYPVIDGDVCLDCGLCKTICPNIHKPIKYTEQNCFVCHAIDVNEQLTSTSGGVASAISRYVIRNGGVVYGCASLPNLRIKHIRIDNEKDISLLKGSKYVQSEIGSIYIDVKRDLQNGKTVLFIGTPCQIAGLRSFLRKQYNNLITIDFVCHGVPSVQYLRDSISHIDTTNLHVAFRSKSLNQNNEEYKTNYGVYLITEDKKIVYSMPYPKGLYILGFINALFYRESCYSCKYSTPDRVSDFTVGDYQDNENDYSHLSGHGRVLSMLKVNTFNGMRVLTNLEDYLEMLPCPISIILTKHEQLCKPMPKHNNHELFKKVYLKRGFTKAARKALSKERINQLKDNIKSIINAVLPYDLLFKRR